MKTSVHDCFRICTRTSLTVTSRQDKHDCGAMPPHRGHNVLEGVKARQHGEDLFCPVGDLGQLQRKTGFSLTVGVWLHLWEVGYWC